VLFAPKKKERKKDRKKENKQILFHLSGPDTGPPTKMKKVQQGKMTADKSSGKSR
jgi:hypothetical protein